MALPRLQSSAPPRAARPTSQHDEAIPGLPAPLRGPPKAAEEEIELIGKLGKLVFPRDTEILKSDPFRILALRVGKDEFNFKTKFPVTAQAGDTVSVKGRWGAPYKGRRSFEATIVTLAVARDVKGLISWIKELPGVGEATGKRLAKRYGDGLMDALHDVEKIVEAGVPRPKAETIQEAWSGRHAEARCVQRLRGLEFGDVSIQKAMDRYGLGIERVIEDRPWELSETLPGFGFKTADKIALRHGHPNDSPKRIVAAIRHVIGDAVNAKGHCGLPVDELVRESAKILELNSDAVRAYIREALTGHYSVDPMTELASWTSMHQAEQDIAERLLALLDHSVPDAAAVEDAMAKAEAEIRAEPKGKGFELDPGQRHAVRMALSNNLCVITGGPGTGKSTILRVILKAQKHLGRSVVCAAPTGRAAKRINETTGVEASTCHKLLQYEGDTFRVNAGNRFTQDCHVIDEFSMVDTRLCQSYVTAIKDGASLIIVGDVDQLPPVGPGQVLRDIIASGTVPVARLDRVFRQEKGSAIAEAAARINRGEFPVREDDPPATGYYAKQVNSAERISENVVNIITKSKKFDQLRDIQVLTSRRKGPGGVDELNGAIKDKLNPAREGHPDSVFFGPRAFTKGDRVMQTKNRYDKNVSNGEVGTIVSVGERERKDGKTKEPCFTVDFGGTAATYGRGDLQDIELAYAATVHKSQGCEFKVVIFACPEEHKWQLNRNLVYTALTRAKEWYCFVGSNVALQHAIDTTDANRRYTGLCQRLMALRPEVVLPSAPYDYEADARDLLPAGP